MNQREQKFWQMMRENLKIDFLKRIENMLEPGWPDVHFMHDGYPGWIELKAEQDFPASINFEPGQPIWLTNYWNKGGYCFVALYVERTNNIYVWMGKDAIKLNHKGGTREIEPTLQTIATTAGWRELYDLLKKEPIGLRKNS